MKKNKIIKKMNNTLEQNFRYLKLHKSNNIFVASDLSELSKLRIKRNDLLENIFKSLKKIAKKPSTIFVPTGTFSYCNSSKVFDLNNSPSEDMGAFSEYVRKKKNSIRSLHPFWSITGNGNNAKFLRNVSKHAYGFGSPWSIMLKLDTVQVNIGKNPSRAVTLIHHLETVCGVPYRFNKQFLQKIKKGTYTSKSDFYMSVFFKKLNIQKRIKLNEHYFDGLKKRNQIRKIKNKFGLTIWSFKMIDFYNLVVEEMNKNIFNYLEFEPKLKKLKNL